ncbi:CdaR family transcriptional regulator [Rhodococcus sp. ACPA1]|uniref:PucR family transcriptional regulator n=1 Tax=Rhodococcus sp. ACPA1 TaxID=2028572 RepID=UPI000BB10A52|nr:helix-turn-helix domain-containing protein [Rhodococcus sp. ACPA1]
MDDWTPVVRLCDRVHARFQALCRRSLDRIRLELPGYAVVPPGDHLAVVNEQLRRRVVAISQHRRLDAEDLSMVEELAKLRARQGVTLDILVAGFHIGERELWRSLCDQAQDAAPLLPDVAGLMLESLHDLTSVIAEAHTDELRGLQSHRITLSQRLLELLDTKGGADEARRIAETIGFDPREEYVAVVWRSNEQRQFLSGAAQREMEQHAKVLALAYQDVDVHFVGQFVDLPRLTSAIRRHLPHGRIGVGLSRGSLSGAASSLAEARLALSVATPDDVAAFSDVWFEACVLSRIDLIEPLVRDALAIARGNPQLVQTVWTYSEMGMSIAATARSMHLHANTVTYRLERWAELTGWNPRTFGGLARSVSVYRLLSESLG